MIKNRKRLIGSIVIAISIIIALTTGSGIYNNSASSVNAAGVSQSTAFTPSSVAAYSGTAFTAVNNNQPTFATSDMTSVSFENYSSLDALGRCQVAYANIGKDLMPTEKRGSIGSVKPSGWKTVKYSGIDGNYLYNRCHLIGYQLTGENANAKNLITGTRYLNTEGMLPFENMVADYIKETGNHVLYRVTPVYEGNNLVASGVLMEGYSVEDNGAGICYNVYVYNVQPGIQINYADGSSSQTGTVSSGTTSTKANAKTSASASNTVSASSAQNDSQLQSYIVNTNSGVFHLPGCSSVAKMKDKNKKAVKSTVAELEAQGYRPCKNCLK